jgi:hypothetical protein
MSHSPKNSRAMNMRTNFPESRTPRSSPQTKQNCVSEPLCPAKPKNDGPVFVAFNTTHLREVRHGYHSDC